MRTTASKYSLERIDNSSSPLLAQALDIYVRFIPPALRTKTNEITYWLDRYHDEFGDQILLYAFFVNNSIAGFAEAVYFFEQKVLVFDYLVLDENFRRHNTFFEFAEHLRCAILDEHFEIEYVLAEVGLTSPNGEPSDYDRQTIRLFKLLGLRVIKAEYVQPHLGAQNFESEMRAVLMVLPIGVNNITSIKRETFLFLLDTIYYKHYLRWYGLYPDEVRDYRLALDRLRRKIETSLKRAKNIHVNGYSGPEGVATKSIAIRQQQNWTFVRNALLAIVAITLIIVLTAFAFVLPLLSVIVLFSFSALAFLVIAALRFKRSLSILDWVFNRIKAFRKA